MHRHLFLFLVALFVFQVQLSAVYITISFCRCLSYLLWIYRETFHLAAHIIHITFHSHKACLLQTFWAAVDTIPWFFFFTVYFKLHTYLNIWNLSISQTMVPQWGLFFSQWCYRCGSLCGGGFTPLTMMQRTYLSCRLPFTAFPPEMLLLPGPLFGVPIRGFFMCIWVCVYMCAHNIRHV